MRLITSMCLAAAMVLAATGSAIAEEPGDPERLWMWGSVERPPPRYKHGERTFFHGERQISIADFVRIAGYPEAADRMVRRKRIRRTLMLTSAVVMVAGAYVSMSAEPCEVARPECESDRNAQQNLGVGIAAGGIALFVGSYFLLPDLRPPYHELRRMEQEYNRKLRVTPVVSANGAGVRAELRF